MVNSPRRRELWLLAAILLVAILLRVAWPTLTEFKFSEARLAALALELTREGRLPLVGVPSSAGFDHSPLSVYLYVPAFLFTTHPLPATIYGGLVGVATVALCWLLTCRWPFAGAADQPAARPLAALLAAGLLAVNPWAVAFSRKIWQVTFVPLLALLVVGLALSALVGRKHRNLAWALAVYAVLVQVHPSAIGLAPALLLWLLLFWREVRLGPLLAGGGLGALSALPFLAHQVQKGWPVWRALQDLPPAIWDASAVRLAWETVTGRGIGALAGDAYPLLRVAPQLGWMLNLAGWLLVAAGLWLAWQAVVDWRSTDLERREAAQVNLVLLTWLVVPVLLNLRHSLELHLHFFALVLPAACLIVGRAVADWLGWAASRRWRPAAGAGLGLLAGVQVLLLLLMARFVATHDTPGGFGTPLGVYLDLAERAVAEAEATGAAEVLVAGQGDSVVVDAVPAIFDVLLRERVAYRFVDGGSAALFPPHQAVALLAPGAGAAAAWYEGLPGQSLPAGYRLVSLDGAWPADSLAPVDSPRLFENGIELQGYRWHPGGDTGRFWLGWQVLWLSPDDTHFFVHLLQGEQVVGQQDSVGYPVAQRRKGDRILSKFDITFTADAPAASLWARVGVYRYPDVVNVSLIDALGNPAGQSVSMGPLEGEGP